MKPHFTLPSNVVIEMTVSGELKIYAEFIKHPCPHGEIVSGKCGMCADRVNWVYEKLIKTNKIIVVLLAIFISYYELLLVNIESY